MYATKLCNNLSFKFLKFRDKIGIHNQQSSIGIGQILGAKHVCGPWLACCENIFKVGSVMEAQTRLLGLNERPGISVTISITTTILSIAMSIIVIIHST